MYIYIWKTGDLVFLTSTLKKTGDFVSPQKNLLRQIQNKKEITPTPLQG